MPLFRPSSPRTLSTWLNVATRGLVPSAQARIRTEIENHYNESVQNRLVTGASEADAHVSALVDLGNPRAAAKRFQKEHLTLRDAITIAGVIKRSSRSNIAGLLGLLGLLILSTMVNLARTNSALLGFCFLYALDVPGVYYFGKAPARLAGIDPPSTHLLNVFRIHGLVNFTLGLLCLFYGVYLYRTGSERAYSVLLPILACFFSSLELFRLRRKLQLLDKNYSSALPDGSLIS